MEGKPGDVNALIEGGKNHSASRCGVGRALYVVKKKICTWLRVRWAGRRKPVILYPPHEVPHSLSRGSEG